jgi:structural maintenance of chromosome 4
MLASLLDASKPGMPLAQAQLYGRLGDLGAIDATYDVAISSACAALDHLVVETTSGAQQCVAYLRQHNLGRATFIILEQLRYLHAKAHQNQNQNRGPPRLFDLVQISHARFLPAFYFALRDTLVAANLD